MSLEDRQDQLLEVLNGEDDLGAVIRAHIYIESALNELIEKFFLQPEHLKSIQLEFHDKVQLALACGLKDYIGKPLKAVGNLRNRFAHKIDTSLGKSEIDALYKAFSSEERVLIQSSYASTHKALKHEGPESFGKLSPKQKFIYISISLMSMIQQAIKEVDEARNA